MDKKAYLEEIERGYSRRKVQGQLGFFIQTSTPPKWYKNAKFEYLYSLGCLLSSLPLIMNGIPRNICISKVQGRVQASHCYIW